MSRHGRSSGNAPGTLAASRLLLRSISSKWPPLLPVQGRAGRRGPAVSHSLGLGWGSGRGRAGDRPAGTAGRQTHGHRRSCQHGAVQAGLPGDAERRAARLPPPLRPARPRSVPSAQRERLSLKTNFHSAEPLQLLCWVLCLQLVNNFANPVLKAALSLNEHPG